MLITFNSLFDIYPDRLRKGAVVGYRKADGSMLEFPCTLETGDAVRDAKGRWTASSLGLRPAIANFSGSLKRTVVREAWIGNGFGESPGSKKLFANGTLKSIRFADNVTSVGKAAFGYCYGLKSIMIPDTVTSIGGWAFADCSGLKSIIIPDSVTKIGDGTFSSCRYLTSITIPESVSEIGELAFWNCIGLTGITIPASVRKIGYKAFYGCIGLTDITILDSVTEIGIAAFYGCNSLTSVSIPDSVTEIGIAAFYGCERLTDIYVNQPESDLLNNLKLPAGCTVHWKQSEAV